MCHIIMKTCSQSESRIVKLDYGTRWRRFPQDLDVTLGSTPDGSGRHCHKTDMGMRWLPVAPRSASSALKKAGCTASEIGPPGRLTAAYEDKRATAPGTRKIRTRLRGIFGSEARFTVSR